MAESKQEAFNKWSRNRPPSFIEKNTSVNWKIKLDAHKCYYLDFEQCTFLNRKCGYSDCPFKTKGTLRITKKGSIANG